MILNTSRRGTFDECRQKGYNWDILKLQSWREADALMVGEAFHAGLAHYYSTKRVQESIDLAEKTFRHRLEGQMILAEEQELIERNITLTNRSIAKYAEFWRDEQITILMPEVKFRVALPNSLHHCHFVHQILHPDAPIKPWGSIGVGGTTCSDVRCYQPHFFTGRTDAVVSWNNMVWLLEHKTSAQTGQLFFDKFLLDQQTTGYIYGIWKQTNVRPHGFILNVLKKPYKNATDPFAVSFEREAYTRDAVTLLEFEREITLAAAEYERAIAQQLIWKNTKSCMSYNRRCYYMDLCQRHQVQVEGEFRPRPRDYVDLEYYSLVGLTPPEDNTRVITQDMPDAG